MTQKTSCACRASRFSAWSLGRFNHVAIATPDLHKSIALYKDVMGAKVSKSVISIFNGE